MSVLATIVVGFGSALLGVVGGFAGAFYIENWRARRTRSGYLRALVSELRQNLMVVGMVRISGRIVGSDFSSETWNSVKYELGSRLPTGLFENVAFSYVSLPGVRRICGHVSQGNALSEDGTKALGLWQESTAAALNAVAELPEVRHFGLAKAKVIGEDGAAKPEIDTSERQR